MFSVMTQIVRLMFIWHYPEWLTGDAAPNPRKWLRRQKMPTAMTAWVWIKPDRPDYIFCRKDA
jgi:hypothetical protein